MCFFFAVLPELSISPPTKGRGMTGKSTSVPERGSRSGWVPVGLQKSQLHVRPSPDGQAQGCGMGMQDSSGQKHPTSGHVQTPDLPSHMQTLNTFLPFFICFIHKLPTPTANSTHFRAQIPPVFHLGKNLVTTSSRAGKKTAPSARTRIPARGGASPSPHPARSSLGKQPLLTPAGEDFSTSMSGNSWHQSTGFCQPAGVSSRQSRPHAKPSGTGSTAPWPPRSEQARGQGEPEDRLLRGLNSGANSH